MWKGYTNHFKPTHKKKNHNPHVKHKQTMDYSIKKLPSVLLKGPLRGSSLSYVMFSSLIPKKQHIWHKLNQNVIFLWLLNASTT